MRDRFNSFVSYIQELGRCLQKIKDMEMKKFGLRAGHAMCLYQLSESPEGLSAVQLTKLCHEDKATISRLMSELLKKGYVEAAGTPMTNYRMRYRLTAAGEKVSNRVKERVDCAVSNGGAGLSDTERSHFYDSLELVLNNLKNYLNTQKKNKSDAE